MLHKRLASLKSAIELHDCSAQELEEFAAEIRDVLCNLLSIRTAHFASNLGVVELCLASTTSGAID
jgi:1-deoxy-D-xylulose-5-phosphate synthase